MFLYSNRIDNNNYEIYLKIKKMIKMIFKKFKFKNRLC